MGERLGVLESLTREGISPIPVDDGIEILLQILASPQLPPRWWSWAGPGACRRSRWSRASCRWPASSTGRASTTRGSSWSPTPSCPRDSDPYLADHLLDGDLLFPAVLGMEAMAQAAAALTGRSGGAPMLENMEFLRPDRGAARRHDDDPGRGAAHAGTPSTSSSAAATPASRPITSAATLRYAGRSAAFAPNGPWRRHPARCSRWTRRADLYGGIFFQGKRFQRVLGYRQLAATSCVADISALPGDALVRRLPARGTAARRPGGAGRVHARHPVLRAGRDAAAGGRRAAVRRPGCGSRWRAGHPARGGAVPGRRHLHLRPGRPRRARAGSSSAGRACACRRSARPDGSGPWVPALLGPYLERQAAPFLHRAGQVRDRAGPGGRVAGPASQAQADERGGEPDAGAAGDRAAPRRRQAGAAAEGIVGLRIARRGRDARRGRHRPRWLRRGSGRGADRRRTGRRCSAPACSRSPSWCSASGARTCPVAATRVWSAVECLRKAGRVLPGPVDARGAGGRTDGSLLESAQLADRHVLHSAARSSRTR